MKGPRNWINPTQVAAPTFMDGLTGRHRLLRGKAKCMQRHETGRLSTLGRIQCYLAAVGSGVGALPKKAVGEIPTPYVGLP